LFINHAEDRHARAYKPAQGLIETARLEIVGAFNRRINTAPLYYLEFLSLHKKAAPVVTFVSNRRSMKS
jgi:hypothetical protein